MAEVASVTRALPREDDPQESALRRLIDTERAALDQSLDRLGDRLRETVDWRRQASKHRGALIAAASGVALLGAWRMRRRRNHTAERAAHVLVDGAREVTTQACEVLASLGSLVSVRRRVPKVVLAPLAAAAARAALRWWEGDRAGRPARTRHTGTHEEESWRLEKTLS